MKKTEHKKIEFFSEEELQNISELGDVLSGIRTRLIKEGKIKVKRKSHDKHDHFLNTLETLKISVDTEAPIQ